MPEISSGLISFTNQEVNRLDRVLVNKMADYSRSRIQSLIKNGLVSVDETIILKNGFSLSGGEAIQVEIPEVKASKLLPEAIPLEVLYEDKNVIVVNKMAGMVVHPSAGHPSGTLVNAVLGHDPKMQGVGGEVRPGLVHRLDRDTSGVIILAKNDKSHSLLQAQFADRLVEKNYTVLVDGHPPTPNGRVEAPIGRDPKDRKKMAVVDKGRGRMAISEYHVRESFAKHNRLNVNILTGRTHQIRVHMAFLGTPVVADLIYGKGKASLDLGRQFLHAATLEIRLPGERITRTFEAPLAEDLTMILDQLRK